MNNNATRLFIPSLLEMASLRVLESKAVLDTLRIFFSS